ncbi:MAG: hypothetical protein FH751_06285 [Firmicutes bacterium]|nr:hypothetical protein [Bacillota bacterium]
MKKLLSTIIIIILIFNIFTLSFADAGPKPTLTIYVKNFASQDYYLDLLGKEGEYNYFYATDGNEKYDLMKDIPLYKYDKNGWKAIHMRTWLLRGNLKGNYDKEKGMMVHKFSYVGVPKKFKIIIQKENGDLQISKKIINRHFNSYVYYDMKTNTYEIYNNYRFNILSTILLIVFTLLIEVIVALLFRFNKWKVIIIINLITQIYLNLALYIFDGMFIYDYFYILIEVSIIIIEYLLYKRVVNDISNKKIFGYVLVANILSFLLGYIMIY